MKKIALFTFLTLLLCTSCVTKKKFMMTEAARIASIDSLQSLLTDCRNTGDQLSAQIKKLLRDTTQMGNSIRQYQSMLSTNMTEQEKLNALLSQKKNELSERERTINELQDMINAQNEKVKQLLNSVKDALLGFSTDELTVREKDGKVYVAMSDKLLFQSGSARLDKRGEEALGKLAEVLNKQTDIDVFIEGHTDNKPINTVQFKDNWDLSVIRATSVVRILIKNYGVNPLQIMKQRKAEARTAVRRLSWLQSWTSCSRCYRLPKRLNKKIIIRDCQEVDSLLLYRNKAIIFIALYDITHPCFY